MQHRSKKAKSNSSSSSSAEEKPAPSATKAVGPNSIKTKRLDQVVRVGQGPPAADQTVTTHPAPAHTTVDVDVDVDVDAERPADEQTSAAAPNVLRLEVEEAGDDDLRPPVIELTPMVGSPPLDVEIILDPDLVTAERVGDLLRKVDLHTDMESLWRELLAAHVAADPDLGELMATFKWQALEEAVTLAQTAMAYLPLRRREILDRMTDAVKKDALFEIISWLNQISAEGEEAGRLAVREILDSTEEQLRQLPLQRKCELCASVVGSLNTDDVTEQRQALARLYLATELDPEFLEQDRRSRAVVADRLREELRAVIRGWHRLTDAEKLEILEKARAAHAEEFKITDAPPTIVLAQPEKAEFPEDGYFDCTTNIIKISHLSYSWSDLDLTLDLIIHENTHCCQFRLFTRLAFDQEFADAGPMPVQAALFALNWGVGYFMLPFDVFMAQPVERHAWLAGAEMRNLWLAEATAEAHAVLEELETGYGDRLRYSVYNRLSRALESGTATTTALFQMIEEAHAFMAAEQARARDDAARERCVGELLLLKNHPDAQQEIGAIGMLITRARTGINPISTDDLLAQATALRDRVIPRDQGDGNQG
ncbi:hypothetical protein J5X84_26035 [Streptosporangiaceae bacterium NEAU-GS5]|nr:hypothetical protein [Streptosporangiaceae bacterium NEAU-GS5]